MYDKTDPLVWSGHVDASQRDPKDFFKIDDKNNTTKFITEQTLLHFHDLLLVSFN